jgi:hypothetical protein
MIPLKAVLSHASASRDGGPGGGVPPSPPSGERGGEAAELTITDLEKVPEEAGGAGPAPVLGAAPSGRDLAGSAASDC